VRDKALIDDCEDGDDQILLREGAGGFFYTSPTRRAAPSRLRRRFQMAEGALRDRRTPCT